MTSHDAEAFEPETDLERALQSAKRGEVSIESALSQLVATDWFVLSKTPVGQDGSGLTPLLFDRNGTPLVGIFTSLKRARLHTDKAHFCVKVPGRDFINRVPAQYGVVVNPGFSVRLEIMPEGLPSLRQGIHPA